MCSAMQDAKALTNSGSKSAKHRNGSAVPTKLFDLDQNSQLIFSHDNSKKQTANIDLPKSTEPELSDSSEKNMQGYQDDLKKPKYTMADCDYQSYETEASKVEQNFSIRVDVQKRMDDGRVTHSADSSNM